MGTQSTVFKVWVKYARRDPEDKSVFFMFSYIFILKGLVLSYKGFKYFKHMHDFRSPKRMIHGLS